MLAVNLLRVWNGHIDTVVCKESWVLGNGMYEVKSAATWRSVSNQAFGVGFGT
jgi:hypothetical protein